MLRLLILPLIPVFVMLLKSVIEDWQADRRAKRAVKPRKKQPEPKLYDHQWDEDE